MEELNILDLKLYHALPDIDESDLRAVARRNLMLEERRYALKEAEQLANEAKDRPREYIQRLENLYRLKLEYTEKTRSQILAEKIQLLEKLVQQS